MKQSALEIKIDFITEHVSNRWCCILWQYQYSYYFFCQCQHYVSCI